MITEKAPNKIIGGWEKHWLANWKFVSCGVLLILRLTAVKFVGKLENNSENVENESTPYVNGIYAKTPSILLNKEEKENGIGFSQ